MRQAWKVWTTSSRSSWWRATRTSTSWTRTWSPWSRTRDSRERLSSIFRTIHTIKGTSGFLAFNRLEEVTHVGENMLSRLRDGELELTPAPHERAAADGRHRPRPARLDRGQRRRGLGRRSAGTVAAISAAHRGRPGRSAGRRGRPRAVVEAAAARGAGRRPRSGQGGGARAGRREEARREEGPARSGRPAPKAAVPAAGAGARGGDVPVAGTGRPSPVARARSAPVVDRPAPSRPPRPPSPPAAEPRTPPTAQPKGRARRRQHDPGRRRPARRADAARGRAGADPQPDRPVRRPADRHGPDPRLAAAQPDRQRAAGGRHEDAHAADRPHLVQAAPRRPRPRPAAAARPSAWRWRAGRPSSTRPCSRRSRTR